MVEVTIDEVNSTDWRKILAESEEKNSFAYSDAFFKAKNHILEEGSDAETNVFLLLGSVFSMCLRRGRADDSPYGPSSSTQNSRSAIVEDFSESNLDILEQLIDQTDDFEFKGRLADIIWLRRRNYKYGEVAVNCLIESAKQLINPENYMEAIDRLSRAVQISVSLGRNNQVYKATMEAIESLLGIHAGDNKGFLTKNLLGIIVEQRWGNPEKLATIAQNKAEEAENENDFDRAESYWDLAVKFWQYAKDEQKSLASKVAQAETFVKQAELRLKSADPSHMVASTFITQAIEAYRRIGGHKPRVNELLKILKQYQTRARGEMKRIEHDVDITPLCEAGRKLVEGYPALEALIRLGISFKPLSKEHVKKEVMEKIKNHPLSHLVSKVSYSAEGNVVSKSSGILEDESEAIKDEMIKHVTLQQSLCGVAYIESAREFLHANFPYYERPFARLLSQNPFVPSGRELIFEKGFLAGLRGDFLESLHLLVPQIENSIRYILLQQGQLVTKMNDKGIQEEYDLNYLLFEHPGVKKILNEDQLFDMQVLLVERAGSNLRNRLAHGLMSYEACQPSISNYLWWLVIHLCVVDYLIVRDTSKTNNKSKKD